MEKLEQIKKVLIQCGGIARTADFVTAGINQISLGESCKNGDLKRIRQGFYQLSDDDSLSEAQYLRALLPEGIVCMESALFLYGYSDFAPRKWSIAVPRSISLAKLKIDVIPIKTYYIQNELHEIGKATALFDGTELAVYDRERTICDCFKYRTRMDSETFGKAINAYTADDRKNLCNLSKYAKELGLYKRVMDLMEVMLNG